MESLDLLANNVANSGTSGFKADHEFYSVFRDELPVIETRWTDFSQGTIQPTGNSLDLALDGKGFFALNSPTGIVYSRTGRFQVSRANQIATAEGYTVRNTRNNGRPIAVNPERPIEIDKSGVVKQDGQELGQIELSGFQNAALDLSKLGASYFASSKAPAPSIETSIRQGAVEQSNVPVTDGAVRLIDVMRQFEMLQRAMSVGAEMNKRAIDEVARPT